MGHVDLCLKSLVKNTFNHSYITGPGAQPMWPGFSRRWPGGPVCVLGTRQGSGKSSGTRGQGLCCLEITRVSSRQSPLLTDHLVVFLWDPRCCRGGFSIASLPPHSSDSDSSAETVLQWFMGSTEGSREHFLWNHKGWPLPSQKSTSLLSKG